MTVLLLALSVAPTAAALAVLLVSKSRRPESPGPLHDVLRDRLRETVLVTLKTGQTYRGAFWEADASVLVLRGAVALTADGAPVGVDGELLLLRGDVAYIQRP